MTNEELEAMIEEPQKPEKRSVMVTRQNLPWAMETTGHSKEYLLKQMAEADGNGVVCVVQVK